MGAAISQYLCSKCGHIIYAKEGKYYPTEVDAENNLNGTLAPKCAVCQQDFSPNINYISRWLKHLDPVVKFAGDIAEEAPALTTAWSNYSQWQSSRRRVELARDYEVWCTIAINFVIAFLGMELLFYFAYYVAWYYDFLDGLFVLGIVNIFRVGFPLAIFALLILLGFRHFIGTYIQNLEDDVTQKSQAFFLSFNAIIVSTAVKKLRHRFVAINNTYAEAFNFASGLLTVAGLGTAIFGMPGNNFFYLYRAWVSFAGYWPNLCNGIRNFFSIDYRRRFSNSLLGEFIDSIRPYAGWLCASAIVGVYYFKKPAVQPKGRKMDIRKKKDQEKSDNVDGYEPVDPSEVNCLPVVTIPNSPPFINSNLVHKSLIQIQGNYTATAFRAGQHVVTAVHCLTKYNRGFGAWLYDPMEKKHYWAPLEGSFKFAGSRIPHDGIAVLHLPQSNYFLSRHSCTVASPTDGNLYCATWLADNNRINPSWAISGGNAVYSAATNNITLWASVESGSSGGPVLQSAGSVVGVVYAENSQHNLAFGFTQEIIAFLARTGGVKPAPSVSIPSTEEFIRNFTRIEKPQASLEALSPRLNQSINGPIRHVNSNMQNCGSTTGISEEEEISSSDDESVVPMGKDKKKKQERQKKNEGRFDPHEDNYLSSNQIPDNLQNNQPDKSKNKRKNKKKKEQKEDLEKRKNREDNNIVPSPINANVEIISVGSINPA